MSKETRKDPAPRDPDGARPWDRFRGLSRDRHYVCVNPNDEMFGPAYYEAIGYEYERSRAGGPKPVVGKTLGDGDLITVLGQVLMSCPLETRQAIDAFGVGGGGGQRHIDELEKKILKPGGVDGLRGMDGVYSVQNESKAPAYER